MPMQPAHAMCLSSPPNTFPFVPKYLLQVLRHFWVICLSSLLLSSFLQNTQITPPLSLSFSRWSAPVTLSLILLVSSHAVTLSLALSVPSPILPNQNPDLKKKTIVLSSQSLVLTIICSGDPRSKKTRSSALVLSLSWKAPAIDFLFVFELNDFDLGFLYGYIADF